MVSHPDTKIYIIGDYNIPHTIWFDNMHGALNFSTTSSPTYQQAYLLCEHLNVLNMTQRNSIRNINGSILDLFVTNDDTANTMLATNNLLVTDIHHPALIFGVYAPSAGPKHRPHNYVRPRRNFNNADYLSINSYLGSIDWDLIFQNTEVDAAVDILYAHLTYVTESFLPESVRRVSSFPVWFSNNLIKMVKAKKLVHRRFKRSNLYCDYLVFTKLRRDCKVASRNCWSSYIYKIGNAIPHNMKIFWKFINSNKSANTSPTVMHYHDQDVVSPGV